ncbi:MAG: DUF4268 domain-containing protein [Candidatus Desulfofervidaceae bacterium]|nr:DUF4268 domain-containing protein [Candidatus Desulfofervidaceae bacterium]
MVGKLESVELRKIWNNEALDFTKWLFDNIDILNEQLGLQLTPIEREKSVGPFYVDILAEDEKGRLIIIENQLEKTDHDHLGKVLTYLSNLNAKVAIWISSNPRPEHITAINYLNEIVPQDTQFYLIKIQAFRIGNSDPAPLFTIEAGPSEERAAGGRIKKELAEKDENRFQFFQRLLEKSLSKTKLFSNVSPTGYQNWINAGAGKSGLAWSLVIMKKSARVELCFCDQDAMVNKRRFDFFAARQKEIENTFGESLNWDFREDRKQQYIRVNIDKGGLDDEERWDEIQEEMINKLIKLEKILRSLIKELP